MRLLLATPLYPPEIGGPATYAQTLANGLPAHGIAVQTVKFSDVRHLPRLVRHYAYYRRLMAAARSADLVLALDPVSVGLPALFAARSAKKPFVVKIVGDYAWEQGRQRFGVTQGLDEFLPARQKNIFVRALQRIQSSVARRASRVIVPSEYLKKVVITWGVPAGKIEVIYNGIELPEFTPPAQRPRGFFIVSTGRRVPWKGFEALESVVAGEGAWHLKIISGLSRAETLGWVRSADVFVLNSSYEGLSHALIEAMMLGTPVVVTDAGGNTELIEDGVTGRVVPVGDDRALRAALRDIADNPAAARERAAAAKARTEQFSTVTMLVATARFMSDVARPT